jgi:hypothetical protein
MLIKQLIILVYSSGILACVGSNEGVDEANYEQSAGRSDCISEGTIRNFQVLDQSNLIITAAGKRKYHMVLSRPAYGLQSTWRLGFVGPTSQICAGFGEVVYDQGFGSEKIRILSLTRLSPEQEEMLLVQFGLKEPEFEHPRTPEKVEGARVEELD